MGIEELAKPVGEWCPHCDIGKGCKIYATKPQSCQDFECMWLQQDLWPEELRPDRTGLVMFMTEGDPRHVHVKVDPHRPEAWNTGGGKQLIYTVLMNGRDVLMTIGDGRKFLTLDPARRKQVLDIVRNKPENIS